MMNIDGDTRTWDEHGAIAEIAAIHADLTAVAVAAKAVLPYWADEPTPRYPNKEKLLRKALARPGVVALLEGVKKPKEGNHGREIHRG